MGEARRVRDRCDVLHAIFRLGGLDAMRESMPAGEVVICPVCDGRGVTGTVSPSGSLPRCYPCNSLGALKAVEHVTAAHARIRLSKLVGVSAHGFLRGMP